MSVQEPRIKYDSHPLTTFDVYHVEIPQMARDAARKKADSYAGDDREGEEGEDNSFSGLLGEWAFTQVLDRKGIDWEWYRDTLDDDVSDPKELGRADVAVSYGVLQSNIDVKTRDHVNYAREWDLLVRDTMARPANADVYVQVVLRGEEEPTTALVTGWTTGDAVRDADLFEKANSHQTRKFNHDDLSEMWELFGFYPTK